MRIAHLATSISINQVLLGRMIRQRELGHDVTALCPDDEWAVGIREKGFRVIDVPWVRHDVWATPRAALRTYGDAWLAAPIIQLGIWRWAGTEWYWELPEIRAAVEYWGTL